MVGESTISIAKRSDARDVIESNKVNSDYHTPWIYPPNTIDEYHAWLDRQLDGPNVGFIVRENENKAFSGVINLTGIAMGGGRYAYLSYYGTKKFKGTGIMLDAANKVLEYGFNEMCLHRIEAAIQPLNLRSKEFIRLLRFRYEGLSKDFLYIGNSWKDHERWAMLNSEYGRLGTIGKTG